MVWVRKKISNQETLPRHKLRGWPHFKDHVRWEISQYGFIQNHWHGREP